jgi:hypothetical protein
MILFGELEGLFWLTNIKIINSLNEGTVGRHVNVDGTASFEVSEPNRNSKLLLVAPL